MTCANALHAHLRGFSAEPSCWNSRLAMEWSPSKRIRIERGDVRISTNDLNGPTEPNFECVANNLGPLRIEGSNRCTAKHGRGDDSRNQDAFGNCSLLTATGKRAWLSRWRDGHG